MLPLMLFAFAVLTTQNWDHKAGLIRSSSLSHAAFIDSGFIKRQISLVDNAGFISVAR